MAGAEERPPRRGRHGGRPASGVKDRRHHRGRRGAGRRVRPTGARCTALGAVGELAVPPGVPGRATDAVALAALGHGETVTPIIGEARRVLGQRRGGPPGPGGPACLGAHKSRHTVTDVSGPYLVRT